MAIRFDHVVVAARDLGEGVAWVESRLGVAMGAGGRHAAMSTHNRLLPLGPGRFLEVIAIDPDAPPPGRTRWFDLDDAAMRARLAQGPALVAWVARTDDIARAVAAAAGETPEILALSRGEFAWRIGVPASGRLALAGTAPILIQWSTRHPADVLADTRCRLERLVLRHPDAPGMLNALRLAGLDAGDPIEARPDGAGLEAHISTPRGTVVV
jgi:hypothetical protein